MQFDPNTMMSQRPQRNTPPIVKPMGQPGFPPADGGPGMSMFPGMQGQNMGMMGGPFQGAPGFGGPQPGLGAPMVREMPFQGGQPPGLGAPMIREMQGAPNLGIRGGHMQKPEFKQPMDGEIQRRRRYGRALMRGKPQAGNTGPIMQQPVMPVSQF